MCCDHCRPPSISSAGKVWGPSGSPLADPSRHIPSPFPAGRDNGRLQPLALQPLGRAPRPQVRPGVRPFEGRSSHGSRTPRWGWGRSAECPIWDWKSLGSRDGPGGARPAVAGEGRSSGPARSAARASARRPRAPAGMELSSGWVRGSPLPQELPGQAGPGTQALPAMEEIMEGVSESVWPLCFSVYNMATRL